MPNEPASTTARRTLSEADPAQGPLTIFLVKRLQLVIRALVDDVLRPFELTSIQFSILSGVEYHPVSSAALARRSYLRPQTMHELVLGLEKRGLVERHRDPANHRAKLVTLTAAGEQVLRESMPQVRHIEERLLDGMSPGQREVFCECLRAGVASLTESAQ